MGGCIYFFDIKNLFKRQFCRFITLVQNGLNRNAGINMGYMRIYARLVKIVFLLNIHVSFLPRPRPVDGPRLSWEQSAVETLSDRYRPRASRSPQISGIGHRARDLFLYWRLAIISVIIHAIPIDYFIIVVTHTYFI